MVKKAAKYEKNDEEVRQECVEEGDEDEDNEDDEEDEGKGNDEEDEGKGKIIKIRNANHVKYCAVITLLKVTNEYVCINNHAGRFL